MTAQIVEITDADTGSKARILASQGFNCFSWRPVLNDGPREMLWSEDGFEAEDRRPSGSGNPLLFPFPGRIGGAVFTFAGREYRLEPGDAHGNAIHGFVLNRPWRVIEQRAECVVGEFQASIDDLTILDHWPADFRIRVSYEVRGAALESRIRYDNPGSGELPCGFGTHAYFRLPLSAAGSAADTIVTAPVGRFWELERMNPTGRRLPGRPDQSLSAGLRLVDHQFDTVFTDLTTDDDGKFRTRLQEPASGRALTQTFGRVFTQCVVYTPGHRQAICLEPYTCVPDAFRLAAAGYDTGLTVLSPGEAIDTSISMHVT